MLLTATMPSRVSILSDCFLQRSGQQGHQLGLVDALVLRVALIVHCILLASNCLRNNRLDFVGEETVNNGVRIRDEVETTGLQLLQAGDAVSDCGDVFPLRR
jgi:hypothetical protein